MNSVPIGLVAPAAVHRCVHVAVCIVALMLAPFAGADAPNDETLQRARAMHERMISIDAHVDIPFDYATEAADPGQSTAGLVDLPKMDAGGLTGAVFAVFVSQDKRTPDLYVQAHADGLRKLRAIHRMAEWYPSRIEIARTPQDVRRIHAEGKHVAIVGMLNGFPLGPGAEQLDVYFDGGLRQVGLTHAGNNDLADSSRPQAKNGDEGAEHGGLSRVGKTLIRQLNARGIIVDVSQLTPAALADVIEASEVPVVASHSAVMSIVNNPRNLSDADMQRVADSGGVVHIVAFGAYIRTSTFNFQAEMLKVFAKHNVRGEPDIEALDPDARARYEADMAALVARVPQATVGHLVDAIDYAVALLGIDHVGISSDFNHGGRLEGWKDASETYGVTAELLRRGYAEEEIAKLWGENWLRVFQAATDFSASGK